MEQAIAQEPSGIVLFRKHCSHCHGNNGAGSESYPDPLQATFRSINSHLTDKAMPEDDPSRVTGETAEIIAETIHSSFYSRIAQEKRERPDGFIAPYSATDAGVFSRHYWKLSKPSPRNR